MEDTINPLQELKDQEDRDALMERVTDAQERLRALIQEMSSQIPALALVNILEAARTDVFMAIVRMEVEQAMAHFSSRVGESIRAHLEGKAPKPEIIVSG